MHSIGELIDRIDTPYNKGVASDDTRLHDRYIYSIMKTSRTTLITNQLKKRQKISDWNYTILPCVSLIKVDAGSCPCLPSFGCQVFRTKYRLPKILTDYDKHLIQFVMGVENNLLISETTREEYMYNVGNKYTGNILKYILEDGYFYVYGKNVPSVIKVKVLIEDPLELLTFPMLCDENCEDCQDCTSILDLPFPMDEDMINPLVDMVNQEVLKNFTQGKEDLTNNTIDG